MAYRGGSSGNGGVVGPAGFSLPSRTTQQQQSGAGGVIGSSNNSNNSSLTLSSNAIPNLNNASSLLSVFNSNNAGPGTAASASAGSGLGSKSGQAQAAFLSAGPNRTVSNVGAQAVQGGMASYASPIASNANTASTLSDLNLDPSDFPALGGSGVIGGLGSAIGGQGPSLLSSYATQASASNVSAASSGRDQQPFFSTIGNNAASGSLLNPQQREFSADDFPALSAAVNDGQGHDHLPQMNGLLNGQQHQQRQQQQHISEQASAAAALAHRQALLGGMSAGAQSQGRSVSNASTYPSEDLHSQKKTYPNKMASQPSATSSLSPYPANSPLPPLSQQSTTQTSPHASHSLLNGISQTLEGSLGQSASPNDSPSIRNSRPLVGQPPNMSNLPPQLSQILLQQHIASQREAQQRLLSTDHQTQLPQTPAQQVLYSPADRFGLLGLLNIIKLSADPDFSLITLGTDLEKLGLDLGSNDPLHSSFITPWADAEQVASLNVEPEFQLPSCYNVQPPPASSKIAAFSDETLFLIFYSQPRDAMQEAAAEQLYKRNWRYHKDLHLWLTKDVGSEPIQKTATYERGSYIFFDPNSWERVQKEFVLVFEHLETRHRGTGASLQQGQLPPPQTQQQYLPA